LLKQRVLRYYLRLIELKGNVCDLAGAFDVRKSLKRYWS